MAVMLFLSRRLQVVVAALLVLTAGRLVETTATAPRATASVRAPLAQIAPDRS